MKFVDPGSTGLTIGGANSRSFGAFSVVGVDRPPASGYMGAKKAQEELIRAAGIPYTIVHLTQFLNGIVKNVLALGQPDHGQHGLGVCWRPRKWVAALLRRRKLGEKNDVDSRVLDALCLWHGGDLTFAPLPGGSRATAPAAPDRAASRGTELRQPS